MLSMVSDARADNDRTVCVWARDGRAMTAEVLATRTADHQFAGNRLRPLTSLPRPAAPIDPMRVVIVSADIAVGDDVLHLLDNCPDLSVVDNPIAAEVAIVIAEQLGDATLTTLKVLAAYGRLRVALIVDQIESAGTVGVVQAGAVAILRRSEVTRSGLRRLIRSVAAGQGVVPADILQALSGMSQTWGRPSSCARPMLDAREMEVIRLLADGSDTREVAQRLCYSERTVKAVIQDITARFGLRNRSHVVAYALREGLI